MAQTSLFEKEMREKLFEKTLIEVWELAETLTEKRTKGNIRLGLVKKLNLKRLG